MEGKYGGWKNLEIKYEEKLFWSVFGWVEKKENKWWGLGVFIFPDPPKCFLPKIERKLIGNEFFLD